MDDLDRMFRHLVRTIRAQFPEYLDQPFDVEALTQTILPYRHHRRELGIGTNHDYELTLMELLSGSRGYVLVDEAMSKALMRERAGKNPDPARMREFATSPVTLAPDPTREALAADEALAPPKVTSPRLRSTVPTGTRPPATSTPPPNEGGKAALAPAAPAAVIPAIGEGCRYCAQALPAGRPITFCPHCGQNLTAVDCQACGAELELGWKFCPVCGRPSGGR